MDKREGQEKLVLKSPAVAGVGITEKEHEDSRKWIASYLSGMDADDFRKRYFKNLKNQGNSGDQTPKVDSKASSPAMNSARTPLLKRGHSTNSDMSTGDLSDMNMPRDSTMTDMGCESGAGYTVVSKTSDVWDKWTKRSEDECRMWYIKTLMARKVFSDTPSIKQQKSKRGFTSNHLRLGRHSAVHNSSGKDAGSC